MSGIAKPRPETGIGRRLPVGVLFAMSLFLAPARAVEPDEILADPALETRAREVSRALRCLVCLNQSIDDSDAPLARDLRILVRERIVAGDSDAQARDFVVARYGEYVLLRPRLSALTIALWAAPCIFLSGAVGLGVLALRKRKAVAGGVLTLDEEARIKAILEAENR